MTSKRMKKIASMVDINKLYSLDEALKIVAGLPALKFDESVEIALNLGIDPRQADQNLRVMIALPHGTGKTARVAVFAKGDKAEEAKKAGADLVGADDLAEQIQAGKIDFDVCIATPDMMGVVGKLGKILGTKGLMPNPKLGTVTPNVADAVKRAKAGQVEARAEKAGIVHAGVGKRSFTTQQLKDNVLSLINEINKAKPAGAKGTYMKKVTLSTTMGPGLKLDISSFAA